VAAEIEAEAAPLVRAAQAADARLALEHGDVDAGLRQRVGGGHAAGAAAEHDDALSHPGSRR
jgi:hypothetical protein